MNETSSCRYKPARSVLLERLRKRLVVVDPVVTEERARQKMKLLMEHQSEFPSIIRDAIQEYSREIEVLVVVPVPSVFLSDIYETVKLFFFGRRSSVDDDENENENDDDEGASSRTPLHWWHGPNSDVDTEEEIELAIRFFPNVLVEKYYHPLFFRQKRHIPISVFFYCPKAMFFIPLLAQLGVQLGKFTKAERGGLACLFQSVFVQLICNIMRRDDLDNTGSPSERDVASTAIMMRLKEKGLMKKEDIYNYDLILLLLYNAIYKSNYAVEERFRFLIKWDPSILRQCGRSKPLLRHYIERLCTKAEGGTPAGAADRFQTIWEFGMTYYHAKLGFIFHENTFQRACDKFGHDAVSKLVDEKLFAALEKKSNDKRNNSSNNNYLQALVFAAAANEDISLDGVYTLIRRDPVSLLPRSFLTTE